VNDRTRGSRVVFAVAVASAAVALGCGASSLPAKSLEITGPKHVGTPPGVSFSSVCTPTGRELCFNAIDDNCNGVIDEGCGLGTGVLQWEIAWGENNAEVELTVTDPAGDRLTDANRSTPSGLHLDRACPKDGCHGQNVENVFFEGNDPPEGHYTVEVKLLDPKGVTLPLKVQFAWKIGGRSSGTELVIASPDDKKVFSFEL
jgi:hypothetical protein